MLVVFVGDGTEGPAGVNAPTMANKIEQRPIFVKCQNLVFYAIYARND